MSLFHKTVNLTLDSKSINQAIREVKLFKKQLEECCNELVRLMVEDGTVIAKMNVMSLNAVYTGTLEESIHGVFFPGERLGVIFTNVPYALFVEYGTGVVGERSPHPENTIGWEYDVHNHGDSGWVYYLKTDGNNQFRWTKGMPSRPFMYNTLRWLQDNVSRYTREAFGNM